MDEYIEREALLKRLLSISVVADDMYGMGINRGLDRAETQIEMMPTADVVPRAEIEHILSDLKKEIHDKAVYPNVHGVDPYVSLKVFDAVINKLIGS